MASEQIRQASMKSVPEWDSMITITLVALIEESFGIQTDSADIAELTSFEGIRNYVQKKAAVTA
jgi:acyl carrier protein